MRQTSMLLVVALVAAVMVGCGDGQAKTVPASGTVTIDGKPLAGANVTFELIGEGMARKPSAKTDDSGNFTLKTFKDDENPDGAPVGEYKVLIKKFKPSGDDPDADPDEAAENYQKQFGDPKKEGVGPTSDSLIPEAYGQPPMTPLKATITADGENKFEFKLDSKFKAGGATN